MRVLACCAVLRYAKRDVPEFLVFLLILIIKLGLIVVVIDTFLHLIHVGLQGLDRHSAGITDGTELQGPN